MRRGTTPTLSLTIPFEAACLTSGFLTISQNGKIVIDKPIDDEEIIISDGQIDVYLSQAETLLFKTGQVAKMQLRLRLSNDGVVASNIVDFYVHAVLKEGEI